MEQREKKNAEGVDENKNSPEVKNSEQTSEVDKEQSEVELLKGQINTLEEKIKKLENLAKVSNERYLALQRELEFLRERHRRELREKELYGVEKFAKALLEVMDNFERALKHMEGMEGCSEAYKGVRMIYEQMRRVLENHGVTEIVVDRFDHALCEAVSAVPVEGAEENAILEVVQKGYRLHDRVLRPAKVVVAIKKES